MCQRMIFPAIARNLGILSGRGEHFSPEPTDTIEEIFANHPENIARGLHIITALTSGADDTITADMTIATVKEMVMRSSDRYVATNLTPPQIRVLQESALL